MVKDLLVEARELHGDTVRCSICMLARVHSGEVYEAEATVWDELNPAVARSRGRLIVCPSCCGDFGAAREAYHAVNTFRDSRDRAQYEQEERERLCIEEERHRRELALDGGYLNDYLDEQEKRDDPEGGPWIKPVKHLTFPR